MDCTYCNKEFTSEKLLNEHMIACEKNINKFKCSYCEENFNKTRDKLRHEQCVHDMNQKHVCSYCPFRAFSIRALKVHSVKAHNANGSHPKTSSTAIHNTVVKQREPTTKVTKAKIQRLKGMLK